MFPVNNTALAQYLGNKQNVWATYMRQATNDTWSSDRELAIKYVIERSAEQLAEEFKQDDAFWSHKICEFMNNSTDQDVTHIADREGIHFRCVRTSRLATSKISIRGQGVRQIPRYKRA